MKKKYMTPQTEVFFADLSNSLCQATGNQDPSSGGNESGDGGENLARESAGFENYPIWEEE